MSFSANSQSPKFNSPIKTPPRIIKQIDEEVVIIYPKLDIRCIVYSFLPIMDLIEKVSKLSTEDRCILPKSKILDSYL